MYIIIIIKQKLSAQLVGAQGYQRFTFSKSVVGRHIALHVVPTYRACAYLVSAFPAHSTSVSLNVFNRQRWNVYRIVNQNVHFVAVGIHFVSPFAVDWA